MREARRGGLRGASSGEIPLPFCLSAKTPEALRAQAERLVDHLKDGAGTDLTDLSFSLATTRAHFKQRACLVAGERQELLAALESLAKAEPSPQLHSARAREGRLAFLFSGQGSQRAAMGKELYGCLPVFKEALDRALAEIDPLLERPLAGLLFAGPRSKKAALLHHTAYAQPALFATELALYRSLQALGLRAELLAGHSVGEITAAHIAGVFDLQDAAKLICARGALMGALPEGGAMVAIEATEEEAQEAIQGKEELLCVAAINAPDSTVISGAEREVAQIESDFKEQGAKTKRLEVSHAFHSPLIEPMLDDFAEVARGDRPARAHPDGDLQPQR